jgi:hypothetical protein
MKAYFPECKKGLEKFYKIDLSSFEKASGVKIPVEFSGRRPG